MPRKKIIRIPSDADYASFDGGQCASLWMSLPEDWTCPGCGRTKRELMRWGTGILYDDGEEMLFDGWRTGIVRHHDHGNPPRWAGEVLICVDCNVVDATAKRILKLPQAWSFSVDEITSFATFIKNGAVESIDLKKAGEIFEKAVRNGWHAEEEVMPEPAGVEDQSLVAEFARAWWAERARAKANVESGKWLRVDRSAIDFKTAMKFLEKGHPPELVAGLLLLCSPDIEKRKKAKVVEYVGKTVRGALRWLENGRKAS